MLLLKYYSTITWLLPSCKLLQIQYMLTAQTLLVKSNLHAVKHSYWCKWMGGQTQNKHTVRENGRQSKHGYHDTCAPHSMPLCCHSLTYLFVKGEVLLSNLALPLPVMPHSTDFDSICLCGSILNIFSDVWMQMWLINLQMMSTDDGTHRVTGNMTEWATSPFLNHDWLAIWACLGI